jgi:lactate permease
MAQIPMTGLDNKTVKPPPTGVGHDKIVAATWTLDLLGATGVCLFLCAFVAAAAFRMRPAKALQILSRSFKRMALSFLTICVLLALGYVIKFSGMDTTLGLAAAGAQQGFTFVGPFIGFLGVALTGSATSSNVLFGSLQVVAADQIGVSRVQMAASNVAGGVIGHIISTSSIVVAAVASGDSGEDVAPTYRAVLPYAAAAIIAFGAWNALVALVLPGYMPAG